MAVPGNTKGVVSEAMLPQLRGIGFDPFKRET